MNATDQMRYCIWRADLWGRNYGSGDQIDRDAESGKLIPGTMPDAYWREGDKWRKQSEVRAAMPGRLNRLAIRLACIFVLAPLGWIERSIIKARSPVRRWAGIRDDRGSGIDTLDALDEQDCF